MWPTKKQVFLFFFWSFFLLKFWADRTWLVFLFSHFFCPFISGKRMRNHFIISHSQHGRSSRKMAAIKSIESTSSILFFFLKNFTFAAWPCERHRLIISLLLLLFCCWNFYWSVWPLKERFLFSYFFRPVNTLRTESAERRKSRKKEMGKQTYVINLRKLR